MLGFLKQRSPNRRDMVKSYARQREALETEHEGGGIDVFVSPYDILTDPSGNELSYSTWAEDVVTWLPRTDCIAITGSLNERRWALIVRWEDVLRICPDALEVVPNVLPERFSTGAWPSSNQLEELGAAAVVKT